MLCFYSMQTFNFIYPFFALQHEQVWFSPFLSSFQITRGKSAFLLLEFSFDVKILEKDETALRSMA